MAAVDAHFAKANLAVERQAGHVLRKNAADQFPKTQAFRFEAERLDRDLSNAAAALVPIDIVEAWRPSALPAAVVANRSIRQRSVRGSWLPRNARLIDARMARRPGPRARSSGA